MGYGDLKTGDILREKLKHKFIFLVEDACAGRMSVFFFRLAGIVLLLFYVIWVYLNDILFLLEIICHIIRFLDFEIFQNVHKPY